MANNPIVTIEMQDGGIITCELYPDIAPPERVQLHLPGQRRLL